MFTVFGLVIGSRPFSRVMWMQIKSQAQDFDKFLFCLLLWFTIWVWEFDSRLFSWTLLMLFYLCIKRYFEGLTANSFPLYPHLCSLSARAARWCWSGSTVGRAPRKETSLTTVGWETAGEVWWLPPGNPRTNTANSRIHCSLPPKIHTVLFPPRPTDRPPARLPACSHSSSGLNRIVQITSNSIVSNNSGGFKTYKGTQRQF